MGALLKFSSGVDALSAWVGKLIRWLVLASVLISAGNAIVRKLFNFSSNSFLEIQWYLFAGVFMLGAGFALLRNSHVRIDFISGKLSRRTNAIIDSLGMVIFIVPFCLIMIWLSWPLFMNAYDTGEMSQNAGGLIRWPVYLLMPVGFALLLIQSLSELVKRLAFLAGHRSEPLSTEVQDDDQDAVADEAAPAAARKQPGA